MVRLQSEVIERVRALLWRRRWSGNELERRAGLSPGYLSQLLNGKRVPSLYTLERIEQALGSPILTIAGRQPKNTLSGRSYEHRNDPEPMSEEEEECLEFERILAECSVVGYNKEIRT